VICKICGMYEENLKKFSNHLNGKHKISSLEYTINFLHGGIRPACPECKEETRYVSFEFKEYCKVHGKVKMSTAGAIGGKAPAWNRNKTKLTDTRLAKQSIAATGRGNHFWGKKHNEETIATISEKKRLGNTTLEERIRLRCDEFELVTDASNYKSRQAQYLEFRCKVCNVVQKKTLQAFERGSLCETCHPNNHSKWELEVYKFVSSLDESTKLGDRTVIRPKEIDIFVENKKIGIECHGLYFHSRDDVKKNAHALKADLSFEANINLLQIFWDEWRDKRKIVESMISHRLGIVRNKLGARKCKIVELNTAEQKLFFNSSHISGWVASKKCWGLIYGDEVVAALSVRKPRQKKWDNYLEIARYAQLNNFAVNGALSRLVKVAEDFASSSGYTGLMTYVDRRIGSGNGYLKSGFILVDKTDEDYWYTDGTCRYDRFKFRSKDGKPEAQIAKENKVQKIYGAGNFIFIKKVIE
jgi:hypothetical protein